MTAEEKIELEKEFEEFKTHPAFVHPALWWSGRMAYEVRALSYAPLSDKYLGEHLERMFYFESRYSDEIIKSANKKAK